jgi:hypothetical protein
MAATPIAATAIATAISIKLKYCFLLIETCFPDRSACCFSVPFSARAAQRRDFLSRAATHPVPEKTPQTAGRFGRPAADRGKRPENWQRA